MKGYVFFLLMSLITFTLSSQNSVWQMSDGVEISFVSGQPEISNRTTIGCYDDYKLTIFGTASLTDDNGGLLFYSDGIHAYNRNHEIMLNGDTLSGSGESLQGALIVPFADNPDLYYLFTLGRSLRSYTDERIEGVEYDWTGSLKYSIVDMTLDNGLGGIKHESKNTYLNLFGYIDYGMAAVTGTCDDFWLIYPYREGFYSYLMNSEGLKKTNYNQPIASWPFDRDRSMIRPSSDGRMFGVTSVFLSKGIRLYSFNRHTGIIDTIGILKPMTFGNKFCFTRDSKYIFITSSYPNESIFRYDVSSSNIDSIINSEIYVDEYSERIFDLYPSPVDPDIIYVQSGAYLGEILDVNSPNPIYIDSIADYPAPYDIYTMFQNEIITHMPDTIELQFSGVTDTTICQDDIASWDLSSDPDLMFIINSDTTDYLEYTDAGEYIIELTDGCRSILDTIVLREEICECNIYIPTAMSINSNIGNNAFGAYSNCDLVDYSMDIYDRWGGQIYSTTDQNNYWNGLAAQSKIQSGVYTYKITYRLSAETEEEIRRGSITVID